MIEDFDTVDVLENDLPETTENGVLDEDGIQPTEDEADLLIASLEEDEGEE